MSNYTNRILERILTKYLEFFSVIGITGPKQSGKSTMLLHTLPNYQYVTFDDYRTIDLFRHDPEKFFSTYNNYVIFDEVQKVPELFNYIKIVVDKDRNKRGKFILTGSNQFSLQKNISESLAGRIGLLKLLPYQFAEIPKKLRELSIIKGCYPELVEKFFKQTEAWFSSYLETYVTKDVRTLSNIGDISDFRHLIALLAAHTAQTLNMSDLHQILELTLKQLNVGYQFLKHLILSFCYHHTIKIMVNVLLKIPKYIFMILD